MKATTILMYGRSRSGKTAQIGELAELVHKQTKKRTRLYSADRGGLKTIKPYIDLGIIEVVSQDDSDPWIFFNKAARGFVRDGGKWVKSTPENIGVYAFEGMTAFADSLMSSLAKKAGENVNIGGTANVSFVVQGDGETLKVSGNNMSHYNVVQMRVTEEVWESQKLPGLYVVWTASASKDDDQTSSGKILGPQVAGKALTGEVPRWFDLTFRIDGMPAQDGKSERHILFLGNSVDRNAGNAVGLGNTRTPLDAPELPSQIEPASIAKALALIDDASAKAMDVIRKRMG